MNDIVIERKKQLTKMIESEEIVRRINSLFPINDERARKFKATLLTIGLDASLNACSLPSIVKAGLAIAELGLPLTKALGQAYIVRYKQDAEAQIGYKGWLALAERNGKAVKARPVFKCDHFEIVDNGFDDKVELIPNHEERKDFLPEWVKNNLRGVLVSTKDLRTGVVSNNFVNVGKLNQIAGVSASVKRGGYSPYTEWGLEMFQGKAIKYVLSKMAMNEDLGRAVEIDNRMDIKAVEDSREKKVDIDLNAMFEEAEITNGEKQ